MAVIAVVAVLAGLVAVRLITSTEQWRTLRRQDRERREIIANVSHDLRTPLTSLHGFLETLAHKRDLSDADRERYLNTALAQSGKVTRLAHELFELARLEHDESTLEREPFSLGDLVHDVVQELGLLAAAKGQRLTADVPARLPHVVGSLRLIDRVLTNLDGPGIPATVREALLWSPPGGRRSAGAGLGLEIVRRILELHGSRIELDQLQRGTRVRFELPTDKPR
jgi:signal transduction histidine kinase